MPIALVSIHDVMPTTLDDVEHLVTVAREQGIHKLTLLVVPGRDWRNRDLDRLRQWESAGYRLAGHGWYHRCHRIRGWHHRLHSWILSRDVAEHLSATSDEILSIMHRCREWFDDRKLTPPSLYVPPAWALGHAESHALQSVPFRLIETLAGVLDVRAGANYRLPLVGFEADNRTRQIVLRSVNGINRLAARGLGRPLRVSLHPRDLQMRLAADVRRFLQRIETSLDYEQLLTDPPTETQQTG